jgi:hypothetical protein
MRHLTGAVQSLNRGQEGEEMVKLKTELVAGHAVGWAQHDERKQGTFDGDDVA